MNNFLLGFSLLVTSIFFQTCLAGPYPERPVKVIVGLGPGSSLDTVMRLIGQNLAERLGQPVVIENRSGAGGNVAAEAVARSAPDGYTLLAVNTGLAIAPSIYKNLSFDPSKDLIAVAQMTRMPHVLVAPVSLPVNNVAEFIALAKAQPGRLNFGSAGIGNADHLAGEVLKSLSGIDIIHIAYRGGPPALADLVNGNLAIVFSGIPGALPLLEAGKIKALAVGTAQRSAVLPNVPTVAETIPGFDVSLWYGMMAPAGTRPEIIALIYSALGNALKQPALIASLNKMGADSVASSPAEFQRFVNDEYQRWKKVVQEGNVQLD